MGGYWLKSIRSILLVLLALSFVFVSACKSRPKSQPQENNKTGGVSASSTSKSKESSNKEEKKDDTSQTAITMGEMKDGIYTNNYFGITFSIPKDWTIANDKEKEQLSNIGSQMVAGDDENLKNQLDLAKVRVLNLLFAFRHPLSYNQGFNSSFLCMAENLGVSGLMVKTGADYLNASKAMLQRTNLKYGFSDITSEKIGGRDFDVMKVTITTQGITVTQKYCTVIINGYAFNFIFSYTDDQQKNELDSIRATIKFK
jgi:hypothetical protein